MYDKLVILSHFSLCRKERGTEKIEKNNTGFKQVFLMIHSIITVSLCMKYLFCFSKPRELTGKLSYNIGLHQAKNLIGMFKFSRSLNQTYI